MDSEKLETTRNVLLHLYNSSVLGTAKIARMAATMKQLTKQSQSRLAELQPFYESLGAESRLAFYECTVAIAEAAVYGVLDFIETYNRFDSEDNQDDFPSLSLSYCTTSPDGIRQAPLSEFGSERLGKLFKEIARSEEVRALADSLIEQFTRSGQSE